MFSVLPGQGNLARLSFASAQGSLRKACKKHGAGQAVRATDDKFANVVEPKTGVNFPATLEAWVDGLETLRSIGAGCREKRVFAFNVKVYAISLYVEGAKATRELGIRSRGGMFDGAGDDEFCDALLDGTFAKMLALQMVRDIDGETFVEALDEALTPRMSLSGETGTLERFKQYFLGRKLTKSTNVLILWQPGSNSLQVKTIEGGSFDIAKGQAEELVSASLCRALFEVWMGSNPVIPEAKTAFAAGARNLVERDDVSRSQMKPGGRYTPNP